MPNGFAGRSPGSPTLEVSVENAVPADGFEFDPGKKISSQTPVQLTLVASGKTLTSNGFIDSDDLSHAVNSESKLSFQFVGEYANWV